MTGRAPRILVVDDERHIREVLADALDLEGMEVRTAANGVEALRILAAWPADLIVLDLMMPTMDGWTLRARLRDAPELARIPIVVVSAALPQIVVPPDFGAWAVFAKPFDLDEIVTTVMAGLSTVQTRAGEADSPEESSTAATDSSADRSGQAP